MRTDELQFLVEYDAWATERVLATVDRLGAGAFAAAAGPGHVAPRSTLLHCIGGMRTWRQGLQGMPVTEAVSDDDFPTLAAVRTLWRSEQSQLAAYVAELTGGDLDEVLEQRRPDRVVRAARWLYVVHLVLHNMQHRSELAQALTLLGHSPGELGLTSFLQQRDV